MTASEVEECLKEAAKIHFLSNRSILLFFLHEHQAERAYQAVKDFFGNQPLVLFFTIAKEELWLVMADSSERHVEVKGLAYDHFALSHNLIQADQEYSIDLFMVHEHSPIDSVLPAHGIGLLLCQQQRKIDVANCKVLG